MRGRFHVGVRHCGAGASNRRQMEAHMGRARTPAMCVGKASKGRCGTHVVHGLPHTLGRSSGCFSGIGAAGSASEDAAEAAAMTERLLLLM